MKIHESAENYLETILVIGNRKPQVRSIDIANELNFSKPSVSVAMKNLRLNGYIPVFRRSTRKFPAFLFSLFSFLLPPLDFSLIYNKFLMPFRGFFYWKNFFDML